MIDLEKYSKVFDTFLIKIETTKESSPEIFQPELEELCSILGVASIILSYYENRQGEESWEGESLLFYQNGEPAYWEFVEKSFVTESGALYSFKFFRNEDCDGFTEEENGKIGVLASLIYTFFEKIKAKRLTERAIYFDRELEIPNMSYFYREIEAIKGNGQLSEYCVGFFNLKRFSAVNMAIGREMGTKVMKKYAQDLIKKLDGNGFVCRTGGDNFIVVFEKHLLKLVRGYLSGTNVEYDNTDGSNVIVMANSGMYQIDDNDTVDEIVEKAHVALQNSRNSQESSFVFYDDILKHINEQANHIESIFREAIGKEEFMVYYQPKVRLSDYELVGAEALCRWRHDGEMIFPNEFIPVLEQSNAICILDFYMLEHVCQDIRRWLDYGLKVVKVSVNMSRRHLGDQGLLNRILMIIDKYEVPHNCIEIELTETTTDVGFNDLQQIVTGLHENGIHTSIDDFGVGYSSLNLIRQLPWDVIKIDKSFLPDKLDVSSPQYILFGHLLLMFRDLGLKCIVEGVETIEQVKMLKENNCFMAQGYYFDKPLPVEVFEERLKGTD